MFDIYWLWLEGVSCKVANNNQIIIPLVMNFSELLNIQKRDSPFLGPSFINSWPSPFPHFPQRTWRWTSEHLSQVFLHSFSIHARSWKTFHSQGFYLFIYFLLTSPYMPQAFPHVWRHCPHGWSLWKLAMETSAHTWCGWRTARDHT